MTEDTVKNNQEKRNSVNFFPDLGSDDGAFEWERVVGRVAGEVKREVRKSDEADG